MKVKFFIINIIFSFINRESFSEDLVKLGKCIHHDCLRNVLFNIVEDIKLLAAMSLEKKIKWTCNNFNLGNVLFQLNSPRKKFFNKGFSCSEADLNHYMTCECDVDYKHYKVL